MPKINLITERRKKEQRESLMARLLIYSCAALAGLFVLTLVATTAQKWQKQRDLTSASQQLVTLQSKIAMVTDYQNQVNILEPKLQLLRTAQDSTKRWYLIYQQTGQGLPPTSWLESMNVNHDDKSNQYSLALTGQSLSERTVADTISQLQRQPMFGQVDLHSLTHQGGSSDQTPGALHPVRFDMAVMLKQAQESNNGQATPQNKS